MKHDGYRMVILLYVSIKFSEIMFPGLYKLHEILDNGKMKSTNSLVVAYKGPKESKRASQDLSFFQDIV